MKNRFVKISIILLIIFTASTMVISQDYKAEEPFENLKIPTEVKELVETFSMIKYDVIVYEGDQITAHTEVEYNYIGEEEVDDVLTNKINISIKNKIQNEDSNDMKFWISGNEIKQMEIQGNLLSGNIAKMTGSNVLMSIFSPFQSLTEFNIQKLKDVGTVSEGTEIIAERELDVVYLEVEDLIEYELEYALTKIAEFEDISILIGYEYVSSEKDLETNFNVIDFTLHQKYK